MTACMAHKEAESKFIWLGEVIACTCVLLAPFRAKVAPTPVTVSSYITLVFFGKSCLR